LKGGKEKEIKRKKVDNNRGQNGGFHGPVIREAVYENIQERLALCNQLALSAKKEEGKGEIARQNYIEKGKRSPGECGRLRLPAAPGILHLRGSLDGGR